MAIIPFKLYPNYNLVIGDFMFINTFSPSLKHKLNFFFSVLVLFMCFVTNSYGQGNFQSGSTGADGAFNPTTSQSLTVPASGVFNFTTVTIPTGVTITFTKNASNTPVTMLATGDVIIQGTINLAGGDARSNGLGGDGAAGGFNGGNGGFPAPGLLNGLNGSGPGGGQGGRNISGVAGGGASAGHAVAGSNGGAGNAGDGTAGSAYDNGLLIPLIGGSGGGGSASTGTSVGRSGAGGGGAILIASSTSITIASGSTINVKGGDSLQSPGGLAGSGGSIKLVANTISGNGTLRANGGIQVNGFQAASPGFTRAEAFTLTSFTPLIPQFSPQPILGLPNPIQIPNAPQLRIVSVAGVAAPAIPVGSLSGAPDITLPSTQPNPVSVVLEAVNVPVGVFADLRLTPSTGASSTVISSVFTSTGAPSTTSATAQVNLSLGISLITASLTVDLTQAKLEPLFMDGERIDKIEVTAVFGAESQTTYITSNGKRINR